MTWEETIQYIRTKPEFRELVEKAYFEEDLPLNVERFKQGDEFKETLSLCKQYASGATSILDIGSGNGISAVAFALNGFTVTASEPDPSHTIGAGAIRKLRDHYQLKNLTVIESFAEQIELPDQSFDIVYVRQAMHHAHDLPQFVKNLARLIKPGGIFFTVRDHVVFDETDKAHFLYQHPLQKFYGGENAFAPEEYMSAMKNAGLEVEKQYKYYDSVINYFPVTPEELEGQFKKRVKEIEKMLASLIGPLAKIPWLQKIYQKRIGFNRFSFFDETKVAGRMHSFIARKK